MMLTKLLLVLLLNLIQFTISADTNFDLRAREKEILDQILDGYDTRIQASHTNISIFGRPVIVNVSAFVRTIEIDDVNMEYNVQLTFRQQWNDGRLKYNDSNGRVSHVTLLDPELIWTPDLFFSNEKKGSLDGTMKPNTYIKIFKLGTVLYSRKISLRLSCPMNLQNYPFDIQICSMRMASYSFTTDSLAFLWKDYDPVDVARNLQVSKFTLLKFVADYCNSRASTGEYSCLKVDFLLKREFGNYLRNIYFPCVMLVLVSWLPFWIDVEAVFARIFLGVAILCTASFKASEITKSAPETSYIKAVDVWTGICLTFIFGTLLESVTVHYLSRKNKKNEVPQDNSQLLIEILPSSETQSKESPENGRQNGENVITAKTRSLKQKLSKLSISKRLDIISRLGFPMIFALFVAIYFIFYTRNDDSDVND